METVKNQMCVLCFVAKITVLAVLFVFTNAGLAQFNADFKGNPTSGYAPLQVTFTDQSQGIISSWIWNFPGGSPSSAQGQGPHVVTYNNPGTFNVTLTIRGLLVGPPLSDTETKSGYIKVYQPEPDKDYGDAPDDGTGKYPTLKANNGACHIIDDSIYLGASVDAESDGRPDNEAMGDDLEGDDEDGLEIPELFVGDSAHFKVTVHGSGYLNAWIDFNQDRDFGRMRVNMFLTPCPSQIVDLSWKWNMGVKIVSKLYHSQMVSLHYNGSALNGEVEDYVGIINPYTGSLWGDSLALVALYNSTDGPNWTDNTDWLNRTFG